MCGIVGYVGSKPASQLLIEGLKRLEYRGYDSAGVCVCQGDRLVLSKDVGRVMQVEQHVRADGDFADATVGIAHTRWATHGEPNRVNAHPHSTPTGGSRWCTTASSRTTRR
jgi:glucosamine--fructose-6-phosphate aminotransferase (isomerizing)